MPAGREAWAGRGMCGQAEECERKQGIVWQAMECASWQGGV